MARIRNVKPSFLRHELLQDLEAENAGHYVMLVFMGLWMLADSKGRFEYKPRSMKLDILPFLDYSMQATLDILEANSFIHTYQVRGQKFGVIPSFNEHQRLSGKEVSDGERFPEEEKQQGSDGEAPVISPADTVVGEKGADLSNSLVNNGEISGRNGEASGKHPDAQEEEEGEEKERKSERKGEVPPLQNFIPLGNTSIYKSMEAVEFVCLNESSVWQESMMKKFKIQDREKIKNWIVDFFETMRAGGLDKRDLVDARRHCFSWINVQLEREKEKSSGKKEKGKAEAILDLHTASTDYWDKVEQLEKQNKQS